MLEAEALVLNREYAETGLIALAEIALDMQHPASATPLPVVAAGSRKGLVPGAIPVVGA